MVFIQLTTAGIDVGPFNLYSDLDLVTPFDTGVSRAVLVTGATYYIDGSPTYITIQSTGVCENDIILAIVTTTSTSTTALTTTTTTTVVPTTTTTTTVTPTTTTTTTTELITTTTTTTISPTTTTTTTIEDTTTTTTTSIPTTTTTTTAVGTFELEPAFGMYYTDHIDTTNGTIPSFSYSGNETLPLVSGFDIGTIFTIPMDGTRIPPGTNRVLLLYVNETLCGCTVISTDGPQNKTITTTCIILITDVIRLTVDDIETCPTTTTTTTSLPTTTTTTTIYIGCKTYDVFNPTVGSINFAYIDCYGNVQSQSIDPSTTVYGICTSSYTPDQNLTITEIGICDTTTTTTTIP